MSLNVTIAVVFGLTAVASFAGAIHDSRLDQPDARAGLRALLIIVGVWALLQALQLLTTDPEVAIVLFTSGLVIGFSTVFAWLYFCSAYTGRSYHRQRKYWVAAIGLYAMLTATKLTNPLHGQYFSATMETEPYTRLVIEQGALYWLSFLLAYALTAIGLYFLIDLFRRSEQPTGTLSALVVVTFLPIVPKLIGAAYPQRLPELSYEPIGVAIFAFGVLYLVDDTFRSLEAPARSQLFAETDDGVVSFDPDGTLHEYNDRAAALVPALGETVRTREQFCTALSIPALDDEAESIEFEREDGQRRYRLTSRPVTLGPNQLGETWFITDITERHRRERTLHLLERAVDTVGQAVFVADREGTLVYVNPAFVAQTGYTRAEALDEAFDWRSKLLRVDGETGDTTPWETALNGETYDETVLAQHKSGRLYTAEIELSPITDETGTITHVVSIAADITDRTQRKQQLTVLNRVLRHNLRNGMNVIQGNAELLGDRIANVESRTLLDAIETRAETLAKEGQKAADIQALFSEDVSAAARYDPCPAIESILAEFDSEYPAVDFSLRCSVSTPVRADERLGAAISELISNAVRHNERTDLAVRVSVEPASADGAADWVDIVVADTGAGIPPHERAIIESGRETPLEHTTGLGLWLVYWTVSLFGGEVSIRHVDGETQVHLRVLAVDDAAETDADADAETVEDPTSWLVDAATTEPSADS